MDGTDFLSLLVRLIGAVTTIAALISQYVLNEQLKNFLRFTTDMGAAYLSSFSFASLLIGVVMIIILYKYRFAMTQKRYFNYKAGQEFVSKQVRAQTNDGTSLENKAMTGIEETRNEPRSYTIQSSAILVLVIVVVIFFLIFLVESELLKSMLYLLFVISLLFVVTVFLLDLYNDEERRKNEEKSLRYINNKIERYFLPHIVYKGQLKVYLGSPSFQRYLDFSVDNKDYRAFVNLLDPDTYFAIITLQPPAETQTQQLTS